MKIIALKSIRNFHPTQACLSFIPHLPRALFSGKRVLLSRLLFLGKINNMTQSVINLYLTIILFSFMMHPSLQPYLVRNEKHFIKIFLLFLWVEWISVVVFFSVHSFDREQHRSAGPTTFVTGWLALITRVNSKSSRPTNVSSEGSSMSAEAPGQPLE